MNITMETILTYKSKNLSMVDFKERFACVSDEDAITLAGLMVKQGKASINRKLTSEQELVEEVMRRQNTVDVANDLDAEYAGNAVRNRNIKNSDMDMLSITLDFDTSLNAMGFENWIYQAIGGDVDISLISKRGAVSLDINNISPIEYSTISRRYTADKTVDTIVRTTDKGVGMVTGAINYGATNVIAPVATMAGRGVMNIGKGLVTTLVKTGTGLFNSGATAVKETKIALDTDPEMIKAKRELCETRSTLTSFARNKLDSRNRGGGRGITIK